MTEEWYGKPYNVASPFPGCVGFVDTFPIYAYAGENMYAPKYKSNVFKVQVVTNVLGDITNVSRPFRGSESTQR